MDPKILAIVPARGGSKGIPRKNIRLLAGKPMIAYTLEAARQCPSIGRTVVSTDDAEIAAVAQEWGAEVPFTRPTELAGDQVTDLPVFLHALEWLRTHEGYEPDLVVHLRPTAPLRRSDHISGAITRLLETDADSVRSVCPASQHPHKMWRVAGNWLIPYIDGDQAIPEGYNLPRQQLPRAFVQNGSVDVAWRKTLVDIKSMSGSRIAAFEMDPLDSINVDDELDFLAAEFLLGGRALRAMPASRTNR
jgi:CMP-N-acetylneuraminic acid synthetase